jgi:hypothetical protein
VPAAIDHAFVIAVAAVGFEAVMLVGSVWTAGGALPPVRRLSRYSSIAEATDTPAVSVDGC